MFLLQQRLKSLRETTSLLGKGKRKATAKCLLFGHSLALFTLFSHYWKLWKVAQIGREQSIAKATGACNRLLGLKSLQLHRLFFDRALFWPLVIMARRGSWERVVCMCAWSHFLSFFSLYLLHSRSLVSSVCFCRLLASSPHPWRHQLGHVSSFLFPFALSFILFLALRLRLESLCVCGDSYALNSWLAP